MNAEHERAKSEKRLFSPLQIDWTEVPEPWELLERIERLERAVRCLIAGDHETAQKELAGQ